MARNPNFPDPVMNSPAVRSELVEALKLDLVGPDNDHAFAHELLPDAPSRWYLSGFLVPSEAPADQKTDETSTEEIDSGGDTGGTDDDTEPDRAAARKSILPSSMGLSVLVAPGVETLNATVAWGDYIYEGAENEPAISAPTPEPHPEDPDTLEEKPGDYKAGSGAQPKPLKGYPSSSEGTSSSKQTTPIFSTPLNFAGAPSSQNSSSPSATASGTRT